MSLNIKSPPPPPVKQPPKPPMNVIERSLMEQQKIRNKEKEKDSQLMDQIERYKRDYREKSNELDHMHQLYDEMEERMKIAMQQNNKLKQQVQQLQDELDTQINEKEKLAEQLKQMSDEQKLGYKQSTLRGEMWNETHDTQQEIEMKADEIENLKVSVKNLRAQLVQSDLTITKLRAQLTEITEQYNFLTQL
ncbi:MAG: hypothetical protein EZS28_007008 [Streblomastix strix]|uniref:Uncharacterized protein n=1 Tax=Streblomastix strix TaxID=222440 RepID=A0A5J4WSS2_9EUKA|nr:MAG: hypothetical protein EZS28_007008 [Streblomastix strix]